MSGPTDAEKVKHYEQDLREYERLVEKLSGLLDGVAVALKGAPEQGRMHEWSDLPKLAERTKIERDLAWPAYEAGHG